MSPSATATATPTASQTAAASASASATLSQTESVTLTDQETATMTPSATATVDLSAEPSLTASATVTVDLSAEPSLTASATATLSLTGSASPTSDATATMTASASATATRTSSATPTVTRTLSSIPSADPTMSASGTATVPPSLTPSATRSATPSPTPSLTVGSTGSAVTSSCIIHTAAGDGSPGFAGDGGPAVLAKFNQAGGISFDGNGNLFIVDSGNNRLRKVSPAGIISTVAGTGAYGPGGDGGPATSAQLANPQNVAVDAAGNIYLDDYGNNRIRKIDLAGNISTVAGNGSAGFSGDGGQAVLAQINFANGLTVDPAGTRLYIADAGNHRIRRVILASGIISTVAGNGIAGYSGDGGPAVSASLNGPSGVSVDGLGNLYISDDFNARIRKVDPAGNISTIAGNGVHGFSGDGGPATSATLNHPQTMLVDSFGSLFIADTYNNRVRKVGTNGIIETVAGGAYALGDGGPASGAQFNGPWDLALDGSGNLYVSDKAQYRVREIVACSPGVSCAGCLSTSGLRGEPIKGSAPRLAAPLVAAPNPAGGWVELFWDQTQEADVKIALFNIAGEQVWLGASREISLGGLSKGRQSVRIDLSKVPSGIYIAQQAILSASGQEMHAVKIAVIK